MCVCVYARTHVRGADNKLCEGLQTILGFGCFFFFPENGKEAFGKCG